MNKSKSRAVVSSSGCKCTNPLQTNKIDRYRTLPNVTNNYLMGLKYANKHYTNASI